MKPFTHLKENVYKYKFLSVLWEKIKNKQVFLSFFTPSLQDILSSITAKLPFSLDKKKGKKEKVLIKIRERIS